MAIYVFTRMAIYFYPSRFVSPGRQKCRLIIELFRTKRSSSEKKLEPAIVKTNLGYSRETLTSAQKVDLN